MFSNKNEKTKNKTMRKKFLTQNRFVSMEATAVFDSKKKKKKYCFSQQVYNWDADQKLLWFLLMLSQCVTESYWPNIKFTNINVAF